MSKRWVFAVLGLFLVELVVRIPIGQGYSRSLLRVFHRRNTGFVSFPILDDVWIVGARTVSFRIVDGVAMDSRAVYVGGSPHTGIDRAQFRKLAGNYWRTDHQIRDGTMLLIPPEGAAFDIESFQALSPFVVRDRNGLYLRHPLDQATERTPTTGYMALPYRRADLIEAASFALDAPNEGRDRRYRYRFGWTPEGGVVGAAWDALFDVVESLDGSPVEPLGAGYVRLSEGIFWRGWAMDVDQAGFRAYCTEPASKCGYRLYARDSRHLYYRHLTVADGDPDTFREDPVQPGCGDDKHGHLCQGQRNAHR